MRLIRMLVLSLFSVTAFASNVSSVYTNLQGKSCRSIDQWSSKCKGTEGYQLVVLEDDLRSSINVITPAGKEFELKLWSVVSNSFSSLGKKAEWRLTKHDGKLTPIALIVRFNTDTGSGENQQRASFLTVTKITDNMICVTDKIDGTQVRANEKARELADEAAKKDCLKEA